MRSHASRRCNLIDFGVFHVSLDKVWRRVVGGGLSLVLLIFCLLPVSFCCHSIINQSLMWGLQWPALGWCPLRSYWKISKSSFLRNRQLSCKSRSFQGLRQFRSRYFFFSLKQSKKQQQLFIKKLIWDPLYPEVWGGWEVKRHRGGKASLPVKQKTNRQQEAGRVTIQCLCLNEGELWQSQNRFCFVAKICSQQQYDSYIMLFSSGDLVPQGNMFA